MVSIDVRETLLHGKNILDIFISTYTLYWYLLNVGAAHRSPADVHAKVSMHPVACAFVSPLFKRSLYTADRHPTYRRKMKTALGRCVKTLVRGKSANNMCLTNLLPSNPVSILEASVRYMRHWKLSLKVLLTCSQSRLANLYKKAPGIVWTRQGMTTNRMLQYMAWLCKGLLGKQTLSAF